MTDKNIDTDSPQWTDPKDFGLPFVEVTPLKEAKVHEKEAPKKAFIDVENVKKQAIQSIQAKSIEQQNTPTSASRPQASLPEAKKSSNSWIWIAALLTLGIGIVIIWQMNSTIFEDNSDVILVETVEEVARIENDQVAENSTITDEIQSVERQEDIDDLKTSTPSPVTPPESGTTIDNNASGNLVRVTEKGERPIFYIIVGSLPTEAMALSEASQYYDRTETIYLIMPYQGSQNYRLAINRSIGFTAMTEELESVKGQYKEALWILKY